MARKKSTFKHKSFKRAKGPKLHAGEMGAVHGGTRKTQATDRKSAHQRSKKLAGVMI